MAEFDLVIRGGTVVDGRGGAPFAADLAITDGIIVDIGRIDGRGRKEIDAQGAYVTPGFVDVHTHYDGQVTWESTLSPSSNHGVTTVVMGNCGVGFAPTRSADHELVIKLMEGVEDVPEVVMAEGVPWNWETFPEYLDALDEREADVDFATQIPHSPLRVFVMGERGANIEPATEEDLARMRDLVAEAVRAGALGVSTSRNLFHRFRSGELAPSVGVHERELLELGRGLGDAGSGVFQLIPYLHGAPEDEIRIFGEIAEASQRPINYSLIAFGDNWQKYVDGVQKLVDRGLDVRAQFMARPIGMLFGLDLSFHPFCLNPSYRPLANLPLAEKVARMRDPELRARILSEQPEDPNPGFVETVQLKGTLYFMDESANYNFGDKDNLMLKAEREGRPVDEVIYDALLEDDGHAILCRYAADLNTYLKNTAGFFGGPLTIPALGDGGAHYGMICDAAFTTYLLEQRVGQLGVTLPHAIQSITSRAAESVGLLDRGVLAPGYKADVNVIDMNRIKLHRPVVKADLPAGGKRLTQRSDGYLATIVSGTVTYERGEPTGALPGRLVRGQRTAPAPVRQPALAD
ncbi:N-acyl-D-amino-acid deacylase family protein [Novosphingobium pokkalii]|uniref:Amidohydrolase family protein n=1 Tax=Novosphingobium pokkalii TaxID=1770194 RepID=A0ABV7V8H0_9SPHN|nr:amidohydrolase family protein [Novosphingobium pokkalii]GHD01056.1 amidohydrolase [Novosphingobium pokkalii]